jgi:RimJ/RimL family protein N-acetyltransferase
LRLQKKSWKAKICDFRDTKTITDHEIVKYRASEEIIFFYESWANGSSYAFTIDLKAHKLPVGRIALTRQIEPSTWNMGFWIHPDHWKNGYATEAATAIIKFGFQTLGVSTITSAHAKWNVPSKRVIEKLGFQFTGENPCGFIKHGKPVPEYEYALESSAGSLE